MRCAIKIMARLESTDAVVELVAPMEAGFFLSDLAIQSNNRSADKGRGLKGGARPPDFAKASTDKPGGLVRCALEKTRPEVAFHLIQLRRFVSVVRGI